MMVIVSTSESPSGRSGRSETAASRDNGEDDATAGTGLSRGSTDSTPSDHHDSRARPQTSRPAARRPTTQSPWGATTVHDDPGLSRPGCRRIPYPEGMLVRPAPLRLRGGPSGAEFEVARRDAVGHVSCAVGGSYFQRSMNSIVAVLTSVGWVALRKCRPPSTTRSSASALLTKSLISSSALATEYTGSAVPCSHRTGQRTLYSRPCKPSRSRRLMELIRRRSRPASPV